MKKTVFAALLLGLVAWASPSSAQSNPGIQYGQVPTAAQWNSYFAAKLDYTGTSFLPLAGGTMSGKIISSTPSTAGAGFNLPQGTSPTVPNNGDAWMTSAGMFYRANGVTVGPLVSNSSQSWVLNGSSSGAITFKAQAAAGTYNFNLPTTAGTAGQVLASGGGSAAPEHWINSTIIYPSMSGLAALTAAQMAQSGTAVLNSYYSGGALGGGVFVWTPTTSATPDGGVVIAPSDHPGVCTSGCLIRQLDGNTVTPEMWGAQPGTMNDAANAITAAVTYITGSPSYCLGFLANGSYSSSGEMIIGSSLCVHGNGAAIAPLSNNQTMFKFYGLYSTVDNLVFNQSSGAHSGDTCIKFAPLDESSTTVLSVVDSNTASNILCRNLDYGELFIPGPDVMGEFSDMSLNSLTDVWNINTIIGPWFKNAPLGTLGNLGAYANDLRNVNCVSQGSSENGCYRIDAGNANRFTGACFGAQYGTSPNTTPTCFAVTPTDSHGAENSNNVLVDIRAEFNTRDWDIGSTTTIGLSAHGTASNPNFSNGCPAVWLSNSTSLAPFCDPAIVLDNTGAISGFVAGYATTIGSLGAIVQNGNLGIRKTPTVDIDVASRSLNGDVGFYFANSSNGSNADTLGRFNNDMGYASYVGINSSGATPAGALIANYAFLRGTHGVSIVADSNDIKIGSVAATWGRANSTNFDYLAYSVGGVAGVTCATGLPSASFASVGGIVTHC